MSSKRSMFLGIFLLCALVTYFAYAELYFAHI